MVLACSLVATTNLTDLHVARKPPRAGFLYISELAACEVMSGWDFVPLQGSGAQCCFLMSGGRSGTAASMGCLVLVYCATRSTQKSQLVPGGVFVSCSGDEEIKQ